MESFKMHCYTSFGASSKMQNGVMLDCKGCNYDNNISSEISSKEILACLCCQRRFKAGFVARVAMAIKVRICRIQVGYKPLGNLRLKFNFV